MGGGLAGAAELFLPALVAELNGTFERLSGGNVCRASSFRRSTWRTRPNGRRFLSGRAVEVRVPGSHRTVLYEPEKRTGVGLSRLGTSRAVGLGAYAWALRMLDGR